MQQSVFIQKEYLLYLHKILVMELIRNFLRIFPRFCEAYGLPKKELVPFSIADAVKWAYGRDQSGSIRKLSLECCSMG